MLTLNKISAEIVSAPVLRNVTISIPPASTTALIGRNGAGKTSVLRTIMGFMKVTDGDVQFDGRPLLSTPAHHRARLGIGYAPEDRRLNGSFTLEGNLRFPGEVLGLSDAEIGKRLEGIYEVMPELKELSSRPAAGLSGGQGKMVALGRALMIGTKVILLDEPFQGLAPVLAQRYASALRKLRDVNRDVALVITESNPSLLRGFADNSYVIERGEVTELDRLPGTSLEAAGH
ncbi:MULTISPECIES: ABC transporter ATP-binding protein [Agrobacterium]|uniref:ATP-binding cassette domain-containing protein n=1 Tax=Agrobacterium rubi TaxID=28099 RepID=A0AAE7RCY7_9HYPH|nr:MULTISPECIES: ATP-binding cassette domain-containing protein [Agrobacterium]MBN7807857.1 ATP-binding cassette domain-containing protein [Agrobacterium rosae]NTE89817.1 ATP-binding cassette domain-containing protein [Agrobacterium rubi]NTF05333.1 ATP-binding cassette domain-containing protein [Agrobacterium rubi]NTF39777.1 ATP-binding cassette domain-containing protein [Agrobacterium rubi]OCJ44913.1 ABC transporter ATP-binding protein [Agrobacterium rubi]